MKPYIVATTKPWNIASFFKRTQDLPGQWHLVKNPQDLTVETVKKIAPRYIFFPHWSWFVPKNIRTEAECVCFHASDVPYGRGGSPIQNLIARGHKDTVLSALKMVDELDAGPIYLKSYLDLSGRAQDIFERIAELIWDSITTIITTEPTPQPQAGNITTFTRRTPEQSKLPDTGSIQSLFDHIRMLDADSYPPAYIEYGDFVIEFSHGKNQGNSLSAQVIIRPKA
jgi:methionyl-tRNA formyltransferase|tara:strand:+ start:62887 stop:63564 length:678 start_codon:yes stop_codon:yes gene_type:complete